MEEVEGSNPSRSTKPLKPGLYAKSGGKGGVPPQLTT